ncbi:MAG TPA: colicin transporter, partial [Paraburkholderia sp.]
MFRSPPTTLTIPRFSSIQPRARTLARLRIAAGAAVFVTVFGTASTPTFAQALTASEPAADTTAAQRQTDFDARQKVLDRRTAENDYRYAVAQHNCYSSFFVNHCLGRARDTMRAERADIRTKQLTLDDEQRAERARQRDEQAALQRAQDAARAPQRAATEASNEQAYQ